MANDPTALIAITLESLTCLNQDEIGSDARITHRRRHVDAIGCRGQSRIVGPGPAGDAPRLARRNQRPTDGPADLSETEDRDAHAGEYVSRAVGAAILDASRGPEAPRPRVHGVAG